MSGAVPCLIRFPVPLKAPLQNKAVPPTPRTQSPFKRTGPTMVLEPLQLVIDGTTPSPLSTKNLFQSAVVLKNERTAPGETCKVPAEFPIDVVLVSNPSNPCCTTRSPRAVSTVTPTSETWLLPTLVSEKGLPPVDNPAAAGLPPARISQRPGLFAAKKLPGPPRVALASSVTKRKAL